MNRKAIVTSGVAAMVVALAACEGAEPTGPVEGLRDDLRYVAPTHKVETKNVDVYTTRCTVVNGSSKCKQVKTGTRPETKTVYKEARYCVELDNVNGDPRADDLWYRVTQGDHQLASETVEGKSIKFTPLAEGC